MIAAAICHHVHQPIPANQQHLIAGLGPSIVNKLPLLPLTALKQQAERADGNERAAELSEAIVRLWSLDKQLGDALPEPLPSSPPQTGPEIPQALDPKDLENPSS